MQQRAILEMLLASSARKRKLVSSLPRSGGFLHLFILVHLLLRFPSKVNLTRSLLGTCVDDDGT